MILSDAVAASKFGYEKAREMKEIYPYMPYDTVKILVDASQLVGIEPELAMERYANGDKSIALPQEFDVVYRDLLTEQYRR